MIIQWLGYGQFTPHLPMSSLFFSVLVVAMIVVVVGGVFAVFGDAGCLFIDF